MIKSIQAINFQSHRDSTLRFSPGVNVIVGDPQNGKTAILRALNLLRTNRPLGFRYHSHFAEGPATMVKIGVQEGASIAITKQGESTGVAYSILTDGKEQVFPKVGTGVPDRVTEILNLQDLNVQAQLDAHFLIADSPADVAREINRITNIDLIDKWTSALNRRKHATSVLISQTTRRVGELSEKVKALDDLEAVEPVLKEAEGKLGAFTGTVNRWNSLRNLGNELENCELSIASVEKALTASILIEKAEGGIQAGGKIKAAIEALEEFCEGELKIEPLEKSIGAVEGFIQKAEQKLTRVNEINLAIRQLVSFATLDELILGTEQEVEQLKEEYVKGVSKTGICPFCLTKLTKESLTHVLSHL